MIGEKAPLDDRRETHGICMSHRISVQIRWQLALEPETCTHLIGSQSSSAGQFASVWTGLKNLTGKSRP
jgi:hypothetical protein